MARKHTTDRVLTVVAAAAAPGIALLIDYHVVSSQAGVDLGALVAAVVGAYHGGAAVQRRQTAYHVTDPDQ